MSPGHIFDLVAIACFAAAALPWSSPLNLMALGLVFFTLAHMIP